MSILSVSLWHLEQAWSSGLCIWIYSQNMSSNSYVKHGLIGYAIHIHQEGWIIYRSTAVGTDVQCTF